MFPLMAMTSKKSLLFINAIQILKATLHTHTNKSTKLLSVISQFPI